MNDVVLINDDNCKQSDRKDLEVINIVNDTSPMVDLKITKREQ